MLPNDPNMPKFSLDQPEQDIVQKALSPEEMVTADPLASSAAPVSGIVRANALGARGLARGGKQAPERSSIWRSLMPALIGTAIGLILGAFFYLTYQPHDPLFDRAVTSPQAFDGTAHWIEVRNVPLYFPVIGFVSGWLVILYQRVRKK